jgi:NADPH-dependent ferric siderophore reductase
VSAPIRRSPVHDAVVVATEQLTARVRRVTVRADALREAAVRPAQDVELHLQDASGRRVKRRYTIRHHRPGSGEIDLDVVLHGAGPGAAWGASASAGETVRFQGPRGKLELRPAPRHLLVGDESALPAIASICEALPDGQPARAVIEVCDADDEQPVRASASWVHRHDSPPGASDLLAAALAELDIAPGTGAYLLGETRAMVTLRAALEQRGVAHESIFVKGYWNLGRPDRLAGRPPA